MRKIRDFANFVYCVGEALGELRGNSKNLFASGIATYGLEVVLYETRPDHNPNIEPKTLIGAFRAVLHGEGLDTKVETRLYSGKDVSLEEGIKDMRQIQCPVCE